MDGYLPVKVLVPLDVFATLRAEAEARGITTTQRIAQLLAPTKQGGRRLRSGRHSGYTTAAGEEITTDRRFGRSWAEAGAPFGITEKTAKAWAAKYATEVREQNMRDRAERNAS
ncbi:MULTISPECIES: hypothetical protein [Microbacterium]|uniref:hypothetical protein n=1 Tax=Microbacterium TaxID=33882 RepID=UPI001C2BB810|nr:hypothetical protein [Microbacterium paraoxydans]QXE28921.1 hypothetical protein IZR02_11020 [Microbacterium paraoxydans]